MLLVNWGCFSWTFLCRSHLPHRGQGGEDQEPQSTLQTRSSQRWLRHLGVCQGGGFSFRAERAGLPAMQVRGVPGGKGNWKASPGAGLTSS